jgi:hypothetical protein
MKTPTLHTISEHPEGPIWHAAIGRVIVSFGTLERVLLSWADAFAPNAKLMQKHHKHGMKEIAPALRRVLETKSSRIPRAKFEKAMAAIAEAISLTNDSNDAAHGWLESADDTDDGPGGFFVARIDSRPKLIHGVRDVEWLNDAARRMRDSARRTHVAMEAILKSRAFF